jgi:minor extracellular serine protease Vpr
VPTTFGFPWLGRYSGTGYSNHADGGSYDMSDALNIPYFVVHFDHGVQHLRVDITDAVSGRNWHRAIDQRHVSRNSSANGFFAIGWDGVTRAGNRDYTLPNGQYIATLSVLKALGDADNPAHWESWTSPVITIARP